MQKIFKKLATICFILLLCVSTSVPSYAAAIPTAQGTVSTSPRIGIAKYNNHYHDGSNYYGTYKIQTDSILLPSGKCTLQTQNFSSSTTINVELYNQNNKKMGSFSVTGNKKIEDRTLVNYINGGEITVRYNVFDSNGSGADDGWIGLWFF